MLPAENSNTLKCRHQLRYMRQSALAEIGAEGQRNIAAATVLIVGCGALGSMQAELAARAGVGRLLLVDRDVLELHNLQRQLLYTEQDVRERLPKAVAAARHLRKINSDIRIDSVVEDITPDNITPFIRQADVALDGTDNFETRYLLNDATVREGKPWIYGGVLGTEGLTMTIRPQQGPCLRCLFEEPPTGAGATCETQGVLNTIVAWVVALQVTEMLRGLVASAPEDIYLHSMNIWHGRAVSARVSQNTDCVCCGQRHFEFLNAQRGTTAISLCGRNSVQITPAQPVNTDLSQLAEHLRGSGEVTLNGFVLECDLGLHRLIAFPDGRIVVMGTTNPTEARSLIAKHLGY